MRYSWWWLLVAVVAVLLVYLLNAVLMPFIAGLILAYMVNPLTHRFERLGMNRTLAVSSVFLVMLIVLTLSLFILIPAAVQQVKQLGNAIPAMVGWLEDALAPWLQEWIGYDLRADLADIKQVFAENWRDAGGYLASALGQLGRSGMALVSWVTYTALVPVVTFYLLLDWQRLMDNVSGLIPRPWVDEVTRLGRRCNAVLAAFLRGQLLVMLCLGAIYALGLSLLGLNVGLVIGFIAGLASIVPFLGFIVGISIALIVAVFQIGTLWAIAGVVVVFSIGQIVESVVLQPKLLGDKIGLHPVAVIFAVLAGGKLFGFLGVLLALPAAAVVMVLLREGLERYKNSPLYDVRIRLAGDDRLPGASQKAERDEGEES
ncbi:AI-2E family transporter [Halomonas garicola]|uniref:AI-2E family transporter n=1 Tax=Halomonas garicola TaxID=1690008 RepID=UPI002899A949|nr:AI-2E family transporter [Halomonas garicola]